MVKVSEPEKSLALGIESETDTEVSINKICEMKFDHQTTSTEKKTGDESDKKDDDEEMLKFILNSKQDNIKNPPIEIFLEVKILKIS